MPFPRPNYPQSKLIKSVAFGKHRFHKGDGDMWPITWAADGHLYGGAGDNTGVAMNFWRIEGNMLDDNHGWMLFLHLIHPSPVDHRKFCRIPPADEKRGIKPAGLISIDGTIYMAVEAMNYGDNPTFNRQRNIHGWIITSNDHGQTWNAAATSPDFFHDRFSSIHFVQFGWDYRGARDGYVYAHFTGVADDGSYWCNADYILLGRVPKDRILDRAAWEFCADLADPTNPRWSPHEADATPVFAYPRMTGENHVSYSPGLKRYIMGNYSFTTPDGAPQPYHQNWPHSVAPSQLTLFEAPEPWGPWSLFHVDDNWGTVGDYQPNFPTKWISDDGRRMWMVSSGSFDDYNFTCQELTLTLAGDTSS